MLKCRSIIRSRKFCEEFFVEKKKTLNVNNLRITRKSHKPLEFNLHLLSPENSHVSQSQ